MLTHLEKFAQVTSPFTLCGTSEGNLGKFYASRATRLEIEPAYIDCLFAQPEAPFREVPREQWQMICWRRTWNDIDNDIFDPWDTDCTFCNPYVFFTHLRYLIRTSVNSPHHPHSIPLQSPPACTRAFLKLGSIDTAEVRIHGNLHSRRDWSIELLTWSGHPEIWRTSERVLIPAIKES
jgi:hypothetical protein